MQGQIKDKAITSGFVFNSSDHVIGKVDEVRFCHRTCIEKVRIRKNENILIRNLPENSSEIGFDKRANSFMAKRLDLFKIIKLDFALTA